MPEKIVNRSKLDPQIPEIVIGIRNLRKITIYPLSLADQFKTTDLITQALQAFFIRDQSGQSTNEVEFVTFMVEMIKDNVGKILSMATDEEGEKLIEEITNVQAVDIAELIFDMNYGESIKKAQSLIEKVKKAFPSMGQSQQFSNGIPDTDSKIASESPSKKAA